MAYGAPAVGASLESQRMRNPFTRNRRRLGHQDFKWKTKFQKALGLTNGPLALVAILLVTVLPQVASFGQSVATTNSVGSLVLTNGFGDLNNDQLRDSRDLVFMAHLLNGTGSVPPFAAARSDINQDGLVNDNDRRILAAMIAGRQTRADEDFDGDELSNALEIQRGTDPLKADSDEDGWLDGWEVAEGTNPLDGLSGLRSLAIARPPVQVLHPLIQDLETSEIGTVIARPPVQVLHPLIQDLDTNEIGTVIARPPVQVIRGP